MEKPRYKEFENYVTPVINDGKRGKYILVVTEEISGDETTTGLTARELRELATYLESLKPSLNSRTIQSAEECMCFVAHIDNHLVEHQLKTGENLGKVCCKICNKTIDEIYKEEKTAD